MRSLRNVSLLTSGRLIGVRRLSTCVRLRLEYCAVAQRLVGCGLLYLVQLLANDIEVDTLVVVYHDVDVCRFGMRSIMRRPNGTIPVVRSQRPKIFARRTSQAAR